MRRTWVRLGTKRGLTYALMPLLYQWRREIAHTLVPVAAATDRVLLTGFKRCRAAENTQRKKTSPNVPSALPLVLEGAGLIPEFYLQPDVRCALPFMPLDAACR